jgi:AraC family transcriptional regulator
MNRSSLLSATDLVRVTRIDHPAGEPHLDPNTERAYDLAFSFVEQGGFRAQRQGQWSQVNTSAVFMTHPGMEYRCEHTDCDDVCLSISFRRTLPEYGEIVQRFSRRGDLARGLDNRLAYLHRQMSAAISADDRLAIDSLACSALAQVVEPYAGSVFREHTFRWYAERVDAARDLMQRDFSSEITLNSMARGVGMSPFHFHRVFSELTGGSPHQHLIRIRLERAAEMLRSGTSVTDTCFSSGFRNLSHFIRSFQKQHGTSPSRYAAHS